MRRLCDICNIQYGYAFDSKKFTKDNRYPPLVRIRDVKRGYSETFYSGDYTKEYVVHKGDLLIGMDGEFNISRWKSIDSLLNQRVCKLVAKDGLNEEYLRFSMMKILKDIEYKTAFVTVKHLSAKELNKVMVTLPNIEEQNWIAESLSKIENILLLRKNQLKILDDLVSGRFVEMFGDPAENPKGYYVATLQELIDIGYITYHLDGNHGGDYPRSEVVLCQDLVQVKMRNFFPF